MAQVQSMQLRFDRSDSPDVTGYRLYYAQAPEQPNYDSSWIDLGNGEDPDSEQMVIDLATLDGMTTLDGIYNLGITALDDAGNKSSMERLNEVPFDFLAPNPPTNASIDRL